MTDQISHRDLVRMQRQVRDLLKRIRVIEKHLDH